MARFSIYMEIFRWLWRLPGTFTTPFLALVFGWVGLGYGFLVRRGVLDRINEQLTLPAELRVFDSITQTIESLILVITFIGGILIAYDAAAFINFLWYDKSRYFVYQIFDRFNLHTKPWFKKKAPYYMLHREIIRFDEWLQAPKPKQKSKKKTIKIGIILAGGGAKGSYQAGAMRAIYEYLEEKGLSDSVSMIAGTSIGAWNALFWLAGLVKPVEAKEGKSFQQFWWEHISINSMIMPKFYIPFFDNSLVTANPLKKQFDEIFNNQVIKDRLKKTPIRFYFTKTNIGSGELEFTTNNRGQDEGIADRRLNALLPGQIKISDSYIRKHRYTICKSEEETYLEKIKDGIFASMTFPPLIPPQEKNFEFYEDGGVIDNLPVYFGVGVENCDLLFVLPLNADFGLAKDQVNTKSMLARLLRVMHVRQGVLERHALKQVRIYNELAEAESYAWRVENELKDFFHLVEPPITASGDDDEHKSMPQELAKQTTTTNSRLENWADEWGYSYKPSSMKTDGTFRGRTKKFENIEELKPISVFAVCPDNKLIIDTIQFWKATQAEEAFDLMYNATESLLYRVKPGEIRDEDNEYPEPDNNLGIETPQSKKDVRLYIISSSKNESVVDLWDSPI